MRRPVSALEAAVAALEPIVEETWLVAVLEAAVAALELAVEEIEPVGPISRVSQHIVYLTVFFVPS
jgi:hypothetical protein